MMPEMTDHYKDGIPIKVDEKVREKKKEEAELLAKQGMTKKKFQKAVKRKIVREKMSFLVAIYQTFEEFLKEEIDKTGITLACKKGCSYCCYQMITCTEMEIDEIIKFIKSSEREIREKIIWEIKKGIGKWEKYFKKNAAVLENNPFQVFNDWYGKPCVFLNRMEGTCNIYPVRIIDCRTSTSLTCCGSGIKSHIPCELEWSGVGRFRFQCEIWANQIVMEEEKRRTGHRRIAAILNWLAAKKRELY